VFLFTKHWWLAGLAILGLWREYGRVFNKTDPNSKFNTESNSELKAIAPRKIIILFKSLGYYICNTASARILGFYHKYMFLHGVSPEDNKKSYKIDMYFFLGTLVALTTLLTQNIGLVWFCVSIGMWLNFVSFNQTITNRYIYMPNAGLMLAISMVLIKWPVALVALFTYYATRLVLFQVFYKSEYWSIEHSCFEQPDFFYPWQNRAVHCFQNGNYQGALGNLLKCNELRPNDWKVTYNLTQVYMMLGHMTAAREWFDKASKCKIDGREEVIGSLMNRLKAWMDSVDKQAKENNNQVNIDIKKFDLQR
jgi:tetratricopeptide (TPR) repeat protein